MRKLLLILFILPFLSFSLFSQCDIDSHLEYYGFSEDSDQYLIYDNVNIRESPSAKASVVAKLPIGSRIRIIEKISNKMHAINGLNFPWFKIHFIEKNIIKTGYVVGGLIAQKYYESEQQNDIIFLCGFLECKKISSKYGSSHRLKLQISVCQQNKEIDRIEFLSSSRGGDGLTFDVFNEGDIKGITYIFQTRFYAASCGDNSFSNRTTIFWDEEKLHHVMTCSRNERYLEFNNGKIQLLEVDRILAEYMWDGRKLQEIK